MLNKKIISAFLAILMISAAMPVYAAMPDGSLDKIAVDLSEGQVKTFRLPDLPSSFTDTFQWINGITVTTTQNNYEPSMWFKIYVPSENKEIEWTLSGVSNSTFTDRISVVITHESELHTSRCYGFWKVAKNATITEKITKAGYVYIHLYGKDVTTDFSFSYSLQDFVPAVDKSENTVTYEPTVPATDELTVPVTDSSMVPTTDESIAPTADGFLSSPVDNTRSTDIWGKTKTISDTEPKIKSINKYMTVDIDATSCLSFCSYHEGDFYTTSTWLRKGEEVLVYGVTTKEYNNLIMAKVNYNGQDGWVANMWLS